MRSKVVLLEETTNGKLAVVSLVYTVGPRALALPVLYSPQGTPYSQSGREDLT